MSWFRSYGKVPKDIEGVAEAVQLFITKRARKFDKLLEGVENRAYTLAKKLETRHNKNNTSKMLEKQYMDEVVDYLRGTRKLSGLDTMAKNVAGMTKDLLAYKSQQDLARAVAGNTGVNERFWEIEAAFRKANPNLSPGTEDYNNALTQYTTYHTNQSQQLVNNVENQTDNQDADNARYGGYKRNRKKLKRKKQIYG